MDSIEQLEFKGAGVTLRADATGPRDGQPLLFLHGSGQTRQSWRKALTSAAKRGYRAVSLDMRGHGDSDWSPDGQYALTVFAEDLGVVLEQFDRPPVVIGASLGGLASLLVAAKSPEKFRGLVMVDITAKIEVDGAQEVLDFMGSAHQGFASLDEAADAVSAYLPHRPRPKDTRGLAKNLRLRDGRYYWHWDPAFMRMGENAGDRLTNAGALEDAARALTIPVLLVRGGQSRIVSEEGAREFQEMVPHADYAHITDAHHMVAGDANDAFNGAIFGFIDKQAA
ncbi:alpha/beta hydrolase [Sphingomonas sp. G-3-2-10]|uniref:alpha/beta fold hydrolase n=1 Tax=Sphingomonas sp. G-3-2-10 TaxID=2728838 RepID=UPI00146C8BCD|nr:alpha/beta hydrolase [Sphingomonas sp. G-3-2-10]NML05728.1 alpha/beta hydrolase [Sphingomonas sp. G-3-2-10]